MIYIVLLGWLVFVTATGGYRWMITPEMLQQTPGVWYIKTRPFNPEWEPGLTLNISSFMTKCLYWHTERGVWSTDGCQARSDLCCCSYFMTFCCHQSVSVVSGGREKHSGAGAVSVQPPHPVRQLLLCDAQRRGHIPHSRAVCHRVAELRGAGTAVCLLRPLPDHSAVGLLRWPQVTLEGQSEDSIISCGYAQTVTRNSSASRKRCVFIVNFHQTKQQQYFCLDYNSTLMERNVFYQRKMTLLEDNHAGALYNYLISVQTGHRKNAGTTANVSLLLFSSCITKASIFFQPGDSGEDFFWRLMDPSFLSCRWPWSWVAQRERATSIPSQILTSQSLREELLTCSCWPPPSHWEKCETSGCSMTTLEVTHHGRTLPKDTVTDLGYVQVNIHWFC